MITISKNEISNIHVLGVSKNKVLIVKLLNSSSPLIVKSEDMTAQSAMGETVTRSNVGAMLELHGTLFSNLRSLPFDTKRLELSEINALRACSPNKVTGLKNGENWPALLDTDVAKSNGKIKAVVKISYIEELADLNGMVSQDQKIGALRTALESGNMDFMFQLGEIYAVDLFIGNHDRFSEDGKLVGPQNLFFSLKGGVLNATGIDTYDVFGDWSDLNRTIEDIEAKSHGKKWPGRALAHGEVRQRDARAQKAVDAIVELAYNTGPWAKDTMPAVKINVSNFRKSRLVKEFHKGMSNAKSTLRKKYQLSDNMTGLKAGMRSRWSIIRG